jgi:hypothetical protein
VVPVVPAPVPFVPALVLPLPVVADVPVVVWVTVLPVGVAAVPVEVVAPGDAVVGVVGPPPVPAGRERVPPRLACTPGLWLL